MIVRTLADVVGTERDVEGPTWRSRRLVLAREEVGFSLHDTVLYAGTETKMWYKNHIEAVYCVGGEGELFNEETGETHRLQTGTLYLLNGHERHTVRAHTDLYAVCVFNPPVAGPEVHDEHGAFPLIIEEPTATEDPVVIGEGPIADERPLMDAPIADGSPIVEEPPLSA